MDLCTFAFTAIYNETTKLFQNHKLYDENMGESFYQLATCNAIWSKDFMNEFHSSVNSSLNAIIGAFSYLGNMYSRTNNAIGGGFVHDYDSEVQYTDKGMYETRYAYIYKKLKILIIFIQQTFCF